MHDQGDKEITVFHTSTYIRISMKYFFGCINYFSR